MATASQTITFDNGRAEVYPSHAWVFVGDDDTPAVGYITAEKRWAPFRAEYDPVTHQQIVSIAAEDAAARAGATASLIRQVEVAAAAELNAAAAASRQRIEDGRRAWAALAPDQRDAMNEHAMKTEGHTID